MKHCASLRCFSTNQFPFLPTKKKPSGLRKKSIQFTGNPRYFMGCGPYLLNTVSKIRKTLKIYRSFWSSALEEKRTQGPQGALKMQRNVKWSNFSNASLKIFNFRDFVTRLDWQSFPFSSVLKRGFHFSRFFENVNFVKN